jgi:hexosaminidase
LLIEKSSLVKAAVFEGKIRVQPIYSKQLTINKATGKPVTLENQPAGNYNPGNTWGLVNGVAGTSRYNDGQWYGFSGTDLVATLDLGSSKQISNLGTNVLNYHWQKMWPPVELVFSVSTDGVSYQDVYRQTRFPVNGINPVRASITPVSARYVKVRAVNQGTIPAGEYGAGGKAWLLVDELLVN